MEQEAVLTKEEVVEEDAVISAQGEEEDLVAGVLVKVEEVDEGEGANSRHSSCETSFLNKLDHQKQS